MLARWLQRQWFEQRRLAPALCLLLPLFLPLQWLFIALAALKRRNTQPERLPVPVVVVGNITVGGAGKTPLTIALAQALRKAGRNPGIVSRGYGGSARQPQAVTAHDVPEVVGDEPLLMARRAASPVWIGQQRAEAARQLLAANPQVDVLLCDDGLQHYRLGRDVEIAVFDGRGAGNAWRLPLGPLREPLSRLHELDAIVYHGTPDPRLAGLGGVFAMNLQPGHFYRLGQPSQCSMAAALQGKKLHAIAGIGNPERFFTTLTQLGLTFTPHPFPDHHAYLAEELCFGDDAVLLMTEKDAVKCSALKIGEAWVLPVEAQLPAAFIDLVLEKIRGRTLA